MSAPLIGPAWRTRAAFACAVAALAFGVLAAFVAGRHSTGFDDWTFRELYGHTGATFAQATLGMSQPAISISICALIAIGAAIARRWDIAILASVGPGATVVLAKYVLKPLLGRVFSSDDLFRALIGRVPDVDTYTVTGTFPSGHESAVAATACVVAILCFQAPVTRRVRTVLLALIAVWTLIAAIGLVRNFWHYATDTIGAILLAVTVVLGVALVLDRYLPTVQRALGRRAAARDQLTWRS
jgi:undecaprenyl-diphosphatase